MHEHSYDDVPVHVRTVHDEENGESYVVFGVEVDGVFYGFNSMRLEAFQENLDNLKQQAT